MRIPVLRKCILSLMLIFSVGCAGNNSHGFLDNSSSEKKDESIIGTSALEESSERETSSSGENVSEGASSKSEDVLAPKKGRQKKIKVMFGQAY